MRTSPTDPEYASAMRRTAWLLALALIAGACSSTDSAPTTTAAPTTTSTTTTQPPTTTTTEPPLTGLVVSVPADCEGCEALLDALRALSQGAFPVTVVEGELRVSVSLHDQTGGEVAVWLGDELTVQPKDRATIDNVEAMVDRACDVYVGPCSSTTTTTIDPAVIAQQEFENDVALIRRVWGDFSDSYHWGNEAVVDFIVSHNHPDLGITSDDFPCTLARQDGWRREILVDTNSVVRSDGWVLPPGLGTNIDGQVPRGRLYAVQIELSYGYEGAALTTEKAEVHVAIINDQAVLFAGDC